MKNLEELLSKTAEVHHTVWEYQEGNDPDWALWYAQWLIEHSNFVEIIKKDTTISELTYILFLCDKEFTENNAPNTSWQEFYSEQIHNYYENK